MEANHIPLTESFFTSTAFKNIIFLTYFYQRPDSANYYPINFALLQITRLCHYDDIKTYYICNGRASTRLYIS